jgi:4-methyl-5(b-hydroxyethyl)-thiazole monophosphate biosynthesis
MILVLFAEGFEEIEALTPVDILRRAGLDVKTCGIESKTVCSSHNVKVVCDLSSSEVEPCSVDALILPGGMPGAINLDSSPFSDALIRSVNERGGHLAAICAAPLVFGRRGLLKGRHATCYPGFENELLGAIKSDKSVVSDGNITTAVGMGASLEFALELVRIFTSKQKAEELAKQVMKK